MAQSQYSLAWDSYKSSICNGFSALQQNAEFVDMTLAADGHLVKVHQVLMALASPYLKDMIASAPCQHPVIFLNNISHKVLSYLLEYIYTGEVVVPCDALNAFGEAARALHVKGLENILTDRQPVTRKTQTTTTDLPIIENVYSSANRKISFDVDSFDQQAALPSKARKIFIKAEGPIPVKQLNSADESHDYRDDLPMDDTTTDMEDSYKHNDSSKTLNDQEKLKATSSNLLFTVSIRGSLQIILNRYIYNLISNAARNGQRRWRCVDYRNNKCAAFVVTKGNVVVNRANVHSHPFHDKKILAKLEKKAVFSALDEVEAYKEKKKDMDDENMTEEEYTITKSE